MPVRRGGRALHRLGPSSHTGSIPWYFEAFLNSFVHPLMTKFRQYLRPIVLLSHFWPNARC